jgi:hypothetical protein
MTRGPGRIGAVFDDILPPRRDSDPLLVQEGAAFKEVVGEVARTFSRLEAEGA